MLLFATVIKRRDAMVKMLRLDFLGIMMMLVLMFQKPCVIEMMIG